MIILRKNCNPKRTLCTRYFKCTLIAVALVSTHPVHAQHVTVSLDGQWEIADSIAADVPPTVYTHVVPVPGLVHSATPAFKDVDEFQSRELLANLVGEGRYSKSDYEKLGNAAGISHQERNYFWYHRTFHVSARHSIALLKISKAQFGVSVYLNGQRLGEHFPCFTAAYFDLSKAIRWNGDNDLTIRVGAHPGVLPTSVSAGTDFEKNRWTPGIYDDVSVIAFDGAGIINVQAAPRIDISEVLVQTELHNFSLEPEKTILQQQVKERKTGRVVGSSNNTTITLAPGEVRRVQQTVAIPGQHLWTPEDPFLYEVETRTSDDSTTTRFGMREFHFDTVTQRAYLNGKPYFLRGSNITLHRFFEDPESGTLPWNERWLQRLLVEIPKKMHWNSFRFCIGPVPDRWLQIADEAGLLIQDEYMVWVGHPEWAGMYHQPYDVNELTLEFKEWMRDNWNHPSVAIWNASNESWVPELGERIIPAVRGLDLSHRPWDNGYYPPSSSDDPMDDHPYLFVGTASGKWQFRMTDLESMQGLAIGSTTTQTGHALILNEYGWLWLNRDGSPTLLTNKLYPLLLGPESTAGQRFAMQAYLLAGETEFWRAHRRYAGVLHFVYLTASGPDAFTADHFTDVKALTLEPHFVDYMTQAFKPLGVYINFWHTDLVPESNRTFTVLMVNDIPQARAGTLRLQFVDEHGNAINSMKRPFHLKGLGADSFDVSVRTPSESGNYTLTATATAFDAASDPTVSRRWVVIKPEPRVEGSAPSN
jgi:beta-galactosidase